MEELIKRAAIDLRSCTYGIALSGAGMSTESGLADFRGPRGIWKTDPQAEAKAYQRYETFLSDPRSYWEEMLGTVGTGSQYYEQIRQAGPNPGHFAMSKLEQTGIIKCTITQNIDGLHERAGSSQVIHYHGTVEKLRCISCGSRFALDQVSLENLPPLCKCGKALKYDVVHFKEAIPPDVMEAAEHEASKCDLMLICGTSAVVYPFAALPRIAASKAGGKSSVRIIEVNAEPTPLTYEGISDYLIQGKTGEILPAIVEAIDSLP